MPGFMFDIPPDLPHEPTPEQQRQQAALLAKVQSLQEAARLEREEEARRAALPKSRVVTLRMPTDQLEALDQVAAAAGTSRGLLLRQLAADFVNYTRSNRVDFRGSLLAFRHDSRGQV
jgi:predicted DNA binding CopG/RHH family protein